MSSRTRRLLIASGLVLWRRAPYIFFFSLCLYGTFWLIPKFYYLAMPGSWWITITQPPHVNNGAVGKPLTLTFCRTLHHDNIQVNATRSFYKIVDNHTVPDSRYTFKANLQGTDGCQYPTISAGHLPKTAGIYKMRTDLDFSIEGNKKHLGYDLDTPVTISDTAESLQRQIEDLQRQIQDLKAQLQARTGTLSIVAAVSPPGTTTSPIQATVAASPITLSTRPTTTPSSAPPSPPSPLEPQPIAVVPPEPTKPIDPLPQQGIVVAILQSASGTANGLLQRAL